MRLTPKNRLKNEDGTVTIFILLLFVTLFVFGGMAVDLARVESKRVELQNTLDSALFAVRVNNDPEWTDAEIMDDFFTKSGIQRGQGDNADWGFGAPSWAGNSEMIQAWARRDSDNLFLHMYGFEKFNVLASSGVDMRFTDIEVSLVVDVSGSMVGARMTDLRASVKEFAETMFELPYVTTHISIIPFDYQTNAGRDLLTAFHSVAGQSVDGFETDGTRSRTLDEIYNMSSHCVVLDRGNYDGSADEVNNGDFNALALTQDLLSATHTLGTDIDGNPVWQPNASGAVLANGERALVTQGEVSLMSAGSHRDRNSAWLWGSLLGQTTFNWYSNTFANTTVTDQSTRLGQGYNDPNCRFTTSASSSGNGDNSILPFATSVDQVEAYMAGLQPEGSTAGDLGLGWGMALLDPSMRNTVTAMINGVVSEQTNGVLVQPNSIDFEFEGRPASYDDDKTLKVLVHMSDGQNTLYERLADDFLDSGPLSDFNRSNVFYDEINGTFSVKYTDIFGIPRYYCSNGAWHPFNIGSYMSYCYWQQVRTGTPHGSTLTYTPRELTKREVLEYFTVPDASALFFNGGTYSDIDKSPSDILIGDGGYSNVTGWGNANADARFQAVCDLAEGRLAKNDNYLTYTIAFDVASGSSAETVLKDCVAAHPSRAYTPTAGQLGTTFDSIVTSITKLRLTG